MCARMGALPPLELGLIMSLYGNNVGTVGSCLREDTGSHAHLEKFLHINIFIDYYF